MIGSRTRIALATSALLTLATSRAVSPSPQARARVLASLADVDLVVVYEEDTPMALLEALRPDALVKGADDSRAEVVGGDLVEGYGGTVVLAELAPGHSTSETIKRIAR